MRLRGLLSLGAARRPGVRYGAHRRGPLFCPGPGERVRAAFPYFSLVPYGYAAFAPLVTAPLTVVVTVLSVLLLLARFRRPWLRMAAFIGTLPACGASLRAFRGYGRESMTGHRALLLLSMGWQAAALLPPVRGGPKRQQVSGRRS